MDISIVALIASIVSICLAFFAIWQANHHRDKSDKLNRDTTEKLARIETFATSIREDAFGEIKRYGDFWRAGGKASEEAEKAKEEELRKLKDELRATTSEQINKVLETVESRLSSSTESSATSEIRKEFEELKKEMGKIQEKGLVKIRRVGFERRFRPFWDSLSDGQKKLLVKFAKEPEISRRELEEAGITRLGLKQVLNMLHQQGILLSFDELIPDEEYRIDLTAEFEEFLTLMDII